VIDRAFTNQPAKEDHPMAEIRADLLASTSRQGTPLAAELDVRLKSDEPLANVVDWWRTAYRE
jgi:hypothetical protein